MDLNIQEIKQVLTLIKVENYHLVLDNKRPLISKNAVNKSILEKLKKKKWYHLFLKILTMRNVIEFIHTKKYGIS